MAGSSLAASPPRFDAPAAAALARDHFGRRGSATELPSERDQNFLIQSDHPAPIVLKIANAGESEALLRAQHRALAHLAERVATVPALVPTRQGAAFATAQGPEGAKHMVWAVELMPGEPLARLERRPADLLRTLGHAVGDLSLALRDFDDPAFHRSFYWDLANARAIVAQYRPLVQDAPVGDAIDTLMQAVDATVASLLSRLRQSVVHGDLNDYNILIARGPDDDERAGRVSAILDLGDMGYSYTVADLAIATAYAILGQSDPLASAAAVVGGYHAVHPLDEEEQSALFGLITLRLCASVCIAEHQRRGRPTNEYLSVSQNAVRTALPRLARIPFRYAEAVFREACAAVGAMATDDVAPRRASPPDADRMLDARRSHVGGSVRLSYKQPVKAARGWMQYLFDEDGRQFLDAYNNVPHVGHCHPRVAEAGAAQMRVLNTNTRYLTGLLPEYAARLTSTLPAPLTVCYLVNSASEANELAVRLARAVTGARDMVVLEAAYHGNTNTLIDLSPYKHAGPGGTGAPDWVHVAPLPDDYRGLFKRGDARAGAKYAATIEDIVDRLRVEGRRLAGFIAETCPSVGGQIMLPQGYLSEVYRCVRSAGGVCIADEVQTGLGRLGTHCWAFESHAVVPDIVVMGKPLGNGHPIGAVVTSPEIARAFDNGMEFFSTFGGNTVSCAIGLAVLDVLRDEKLQAHARDVGAELLAALRRLGERYAIVGDVRGSGLFIGVELVKDRTTLDPATVEASEIVNHMREQGVLIGTEGPHENVLKIRPPMPFASTDIPTLVDALEASLGRAQ